MDSSKINQVYYIYPTESPKLPLELQPDKFPTHSKITKDFEINKNSNFTNSISIICEKMSLSDVISGKYSPEQYQTACGTDICNQIKGIIDTTNTDNKCVKPELLSMYKNSCSGNVSSYTTCKENLPDQNLIITKIENGVENPLTIQDIESVTVNGKDITNCEIILEKGDDLFATPVTNNITEDNNSSISVNDSLINKALIEQILLPESNSVISDMGNAKFIQRTSGRFSIQNIESRVIKIKLKGSNSPVMIPLLPETINSTLRVGIDLTNNQLIVGTVKKDSSLDISDSSVPYTIIKNNVMSIYKNHTHASFKAESGKLVTASNIENTKPSLKPLTPINDYIGSWLYKYTGKEEKDNKEIILDLKNSDNNKYMASTTIDGDKYTSNESYGDTVSLLDVKSSRNSNKIEGKFELNGHNKLVGTLIETTDPDLVKYKDTSYDMEPIPCQK